MVVDPGQSCGLPACYDALLLVGPTGSGKSPLGELLEERGLRGRRCHHFDFGARLREAARTAPAEFREEEIGFIREVLDKGLLLENETFGLALRILERFARQRNFQGADLLILNGLPRHAGQAAALEGVVRIRAILELHCDASTVAERLKRNTGGDRAGRADDGPPLVERKLQVYAGRTLPLLDYYRRKGVPVHSFEVSAGTQADEILPLLPAFGSLPGNP